MDVPDLWHGNVHKTLDWSFSLAFVPTTAFFFYTIGHQKHSRVLYRLDE